MYCKGAAMKVALVHYWLVSMRGGEKVLEELCEMFPDADIFTHVYDRRVVSPIIHRHVVKTTMIDKLPFSRRLYKNYLPLMPIALEQLDLRDYDLVISSESGPAKGVLTRPDAIHICYCHTPMRYIWNMYLDYRQSVSPLLRPFMTLIAASLRQSDQCSANRVDLFVANSNNIRRQIRKYYGREAVVVHPPVDVDAFHRTGEKSADFYLAVGQLVRYKRMDLAIEACNQLKRRLIIIGEGEEAKALKKIAGPTISFLGRQDFAEIRNHYAWCKALLFPGEEDFGIVPVEAMASGKPVIAWRRGGALETVIAGQTGLFFDRPTADSLARTILDFEAVEDSFDPELISLHARKFSKETFKQRLSRVLEEYVDDNADASLGRSLPWDAALAGPMPALSQPIHLPTAAD
jgi:glycosyltransferase involved in cell wall biosynthesis